MITSYPSIFTVGHKSVICLLKSLVVVEEKIDGSQFSFLVNKDGELEVRSKGSIINILAPPKMFNKGVDYLLSIKDRIPKGYTFRGEYLNSNKHNTLIYSRVPKNNIIIFDICSGIENYVARKLKIKLSNLLDLEVVPILFEGFLSDPKQIRDFLELESILGGQRIEGVVIKPASYDLFGIDKKLLIAKFVSEDFKEVHAATWKQENGPKSSKDILDILKLSYATPARWNKAIVHLKEKEELSGSMKDIPALMAEVPKDILKECEQEIKDKLFEWAWPAPSRSCVKGIPEFYKEYLLNNSFNSDL